ncbi:hypothetical protein [Acidianus sp. HS-5]|uniref:hypothetical protein n=1 Tax=Acidianus sp. HS-5 TaxID=2886040 RepID=UPI001F2E5566|nr:hypothetical protein [Acidianus sp. HS-5]BDC19041.1 hypothetical protein HS5_19310 [Acidianus sp. HS-5]
MKLSLAYSKEEELLPILPILDKEIDKGIEIEAIKIKEEEIKFKYDKFDLYYIPLPDLNYIETKILSNGAYVVNSLGLDELKSEVCINSNSTEFYLLKLLMNYRGIPNGRENCKGSKFTIKDFKVSLSDKWKETCGDLPIVLNVIGSNLPGDVISKVKITIRESASLQESKGVIATPSKELGLKGRKAIDCFFELCRKKSLCNVNNYVIL